jgi:PhnB protein
MESVHPYLNFKGDAGEAFAFCRSVFGGESLGVVRFRNFGGADMGVAEENLGKIAHIALPLADGVSLMASDVVGAGAESFVAGTNSYVYLETDSAEEADRVFDALSSG